MSRRVCAALCAVGLLLPLRAGAQSVDRTGWALDRFVPAPVGDRTFLGEHPRYAPRWSIGAGVLTEHAVDPLLVRRVYSGGRTTLAPVVGAMTVSHFNVHGSFLGRVGVTLSLPISWSQTGEEVPLGTTSLGPETGVAVGDLRVGARVRIYGEADRSPFSVHLGANVWLPTGRRGDNTSDDAVRSESRVILAGRYRFLRWSWVTAFTYRRALNALNVAIGPELLARASLGFVLLRGRLVLGPEATLWTPVRNLPSGGGTAFFARGQWGFELLASAHWTPIDGLNVGLGAGPGIERGQGTPAARFLASVEWTPDFAGRRRTR